jgi:3-oxoadipate enol-lactonase
MNGPLVAATDRRVARHRTSYGTFATREGAQPRDAPLVVLLHGTGTSKRLFAGVIDALPELCCVAVDVLGHGESDAPPYEFTLPAHAEALIELIEQLREARPVVLAGCSLGAILSIEIASRAPWLADAVLLNGCPGWHLESQRTARVRGLTERLLDADARPLPDAEMPGTVAPASEEERAARRADVQRAGRWLLSTSWAVAAYDLAARLPRIRATTTVLMGDQDWHMPTSYVLVEGIERAVLEVLPNCGHISPYDDPQGVAESIRRLWARSQAEAARGA